MRQAATTALASAPPQLHHPITYTQVGDLPLTSCWFGACSQTHLNFKMAAEDLRLDKERHLKYWQRCRNSYLPSPYTAADSTRLMWACFIFSALDVLSVPLEAKERANIRDWVLSLQHPDGGFCGSPTHAYDGPDASKGGANLAATFFALILLAVAAEDDEAGAKGAFAGVQRRKLLRWVRKLQRDDGSFGQNLWEGKPVGGSDTRHSYLATSIRWMLRGDVRPGDEAWEEDIDLDATAAHIRRGQAYDGGLAESNEQESHGAFHAWRSEFIY